VGRADPVMAAVPASPGDAAPGKCDGGTGGANGCCVRARAPQSSTDDADRAGGSQDGYENSGDTTPPGAASPTMLGGHDAEARVRFRPMVGRDTRASVVSSDLIRHSDITRADRVVGASPDSTRLVAILRG
jgi:hypothetical protein